MRTYTLIRIFLISDFKEVVSSNHTLKNNVKLIKDKGLTVVESDEFFPTLKFYDVGAVVYFAKVIQWEFPKFSVNNCIKQLCELQSIVEEKGFIKSKEHRFFIVAKKLGLRDKKSFLI